MKSKNIVFAALFKKYRLRSEIETLSEFASLLADEGMIYAISLYTRWQNGERIPTDRRAAISMIKIFVKRGGLNSVDAANELLTCIGMRDLSKEEIEEIQSIFVLTINSNEFKNNVRYFCRNQYLNTWNILYKFFTFKPNLIMIILFIFFSLIWLIWGARIPYYIGNAYAVMALIGILFSIHLSFKLNYHKKFISISLFFFGVGLSCQLVGQIFYGYYIIVKNIQIPYPSYGDIGYIGTIPFYILGLLYLARSLGIKIRIFNIIYYKKINTIIFPLVILVITYFHLLRNYHFEFYNIERIILDFSYPLGQTIYIFISLLILSLTKGVLGDMQTKIRFIIVALLAQYVADYVFIYQAHEGIWINGGINDYLYYVSYSLMTLAILQFYKPPFNKRLQ